MKAERKRETEAEAKERRTDALTSLLLLLALGRRAFSLDHSCSPRPQSPRPHSPRRFEKRRRDWRVTKEPEQTCHFHSSPFFPWTSSDENSYKRTVYLFVFILFVSEPSSLDSGCIRARGVRYARLPFAFRPSVSLLAPDYSFFFRVSEKEKAFLPSFNVKWKGEGGRREFFAHFVRFCRRGERGGEARGWLSFRRKYKSEKKSLGG